MDDRTGFQGHKESTQTALALVDIGGLMKKDKYVFNNLEAGVEIKKGDGHCDPYIILITLKGSRKDMETIAKFTKAGGALIRFSSEHPQHLGLLGVESKDKGSMTFEFWAKERKGL